MNYIGHMLIIGFALGYTIRFKVPNTIKGVSISNPSIEVQVKLGSFEIAYYC